MGRGVVINGITQDQQKQNSRHALHMKTKCIQRCTSCHFKIVHLIVRFYSVTNTVDTIQRTLFTDAPIFIPSVAALLAVPRRVACCSCCLLGAREGFVSNFKTILRFLQSESRRGSNGRMLDRCYFHRNIIYFCLTKEFNRAITVFCCRLEPLLHLIQTLKM